ncbi:MAG: efflux RND transporter periplasmic adaptor subunit [Candidatus Gastranaerophilales bacterium]|nr:efflux RND transporter periplasmic adaptor subunit [Candidatus Gastranaerophilales bacterium]
MTEKKKKLILIIAILVICLPIIYNRTMSFIAAKMMAKMRLAPPVVEVAPVKEQDVYAKAESSGRLEAKYSVDVVARINGWLQKRYFKEGAYVKKGQTLFLIEPNEYQIAVQNASASVRQTKAALINSEKELRRANELVKNDFVSKSYYDQAVATRDQNKAMLDVNRAQLANANLNLSYTRVVSPIDGKIGKIMITEGNLVNPQAGSLAKIVSVDPIYAYFNLKSEDYLKFKKSDTSVDLNKMKVQIKLADGSNYPITGKIEFVNNTVDPSAGTIALRATFPNKDRLLVPGDFVTVVASATVPRKVVVAPQAAVSDSADGYFVWVIDADGKAQQKKIKVSEQVGSNWLVEEGLKPNEVIIVKGIQSIKQGMKVKIADTTTQSEKKDK